VRYLIASDLHFALQQFDWIAEQAAEFDAVILCGDHLDVAGHVEIRAQASLITAFLGALADQTVVVVNSGNHDLIGRGEHGEKAALWLDDLDPRVVRDGQRVTVGNDLVSACCWWEGPVTRGALEAQLTADAAHRPDDGSWIWAYHSPPDQSPTSWSGSRHYGDDVLNRLIAQHRPTVVVTGHVHESPFRPDGSWHDRIDGTLVLNAGRQPGPVPAHIILDTASDPATGQAMWWTLEASETIPT
jgi:Icc-related predicted phosphoesterase